MSALRGLTALLCALPVFSFGQNSGSGVTVVTSNGDWQVGSRILKAKDTVPAGSTITAHGTNAGSLVLKCGNTEVVSYRCDANDCRVTACASSAQGATVRRIDFGPETPSAADMSDALFRHELKQPELAGVRAPGNPRDAVLLQTSAGVQFGPALKGVLDGPVCLQLTPLPPQASQTPVIVTFSWDPDGSAEGNAAAPGLAPGLYLLDKGAPSSTGGCEIDSAAVASWVLIASQKAFPGLSGKWKAIAAQMDALSKEDISRDVIITMHHAALAFLADSAAKQE